MRNSQYLGPIPWKNTISANTSINQRLSRFEIILRNETFEGRLIFWSFLATFNHRSIDFRSHPYLFTQQILILSIIFVFLVATRKFLWISLFCQIFGSSIPSKLSFINFGLEKLCEESSILRLYLRIVVIFFVRNFTSLRLNRQFFYLWRFVQSCLCSIYIFFRVFSIWIYNFFCFYESILGSHLDLSRRICWHWVLFWQNLFLEAP